jgi:amino acid transporter
MGKIEDIMVYTKLVIIFIISLALIYFGKTDFHTFAQILAKDFEQSSFMNILIVASVTFVAYEGFQLVINAVNEMDQPEKNIPRAIYSAIVLAIIIYVIIAVGALFAIPVEDIVKNQEFALAAGAGDVLGSLGTNLVILGAVLATSSAISGTLFGASRQMAVVAKDGYFPQILSQRKQTVPINAIICMAVISSILILLGGLKLILEFGSITFLLVSVLMAIANFKIRKKTKSSTTLTLISIIGLLMGGILILYYEFTTNLDQMLYIVALYFLLSLSAWIFSKMKSTTKLG